jgi:hypothetical protein
MPTKKKKKKKIWGRRRGHVRKTGRALTAL